MDDDAPQLSPKASAARLQLHSRTRPLKWVCMFSPGTAQARFRSILKAWNCFGKTDSRWFFSAIFLISVFHMLQWMPTASIAQVKIAHAGSQWSKQPSAVSCSLCARFYWSFGVTIHFNTVQFGCQMQKPISLQTWVENRATQPNTTQGPLSKISKVERPQAKNYWAVFNSYNDFVARFMANLINKETQK